MYYQIKCQQVLAVSLWGGGNWKHSLVKKATIHQVTTMIATSEIVYCLYPSHNHLLTTGTDVPSLADTRATMKVSGHQYLGLTGGYDLEIGHF